MMPSANGAFTPSTSSAMVETAPITSIAMSCVTSHLRSIVDIAVSTSRGALAPRLREEMQDPVAIGVRVGADVDRHDEDQHQPRHRLERRGDEREDVARRRRRGACRCSREHVDGPPCTWFEVSFAAGAPAAPEGCAPCGPAPDCRGSAGFAPVESAGAAVLRAVGAKYRRHQRRIFPVQPLLGALDGLGQALPQLVTLLRDRRRDEGAERVHDQQEADDEEAGADARAEL